MKLSYLLLGLTLCSFNAIADESSTVDAAIGAAIGAAVGAAVGNEVGGKEGAVLGGGIGGATGAAVATDSEPSSAKAYIEPSHSQKFCPPGQAKKGNC